MEAEGNGCLLRFRISVQNVKNSKTNGMPSFITNCNFWTGKEGGILTDISNFENGFVMGWRFSFFFFFRELALIRNCVRMKKNEVNFDRFLYAKKLLTQSYLNILFETILNSSNSWKISIYEKLNEIFFLHSKIVSAYNI